MTQVSTIKPGTRGFDCLTDPAPPAVMAADGWLFRNLYCAPTSKYATKVTNATRAKAPARIKEILDAGIGLLLNFESSTARPLAGGAAGVADGRWMATLCAELGYPEGLPVKVSFDIETRINIGTVQDPIIVVRPECIDYGRAFAAELAPHWTFGIYGGTPIMHELADICALGWKALATSWSSGGYWPKAVVHIKQRRPTAAETEQWPYATKYAMDADDALLPFPVWLPSPDPEVVEPPVPVPAPKPVYPYEWPGGTHMIPVDYGVAGVDPWWTEMAITSKGLQWSGGPTPESQKIHEIILAANPVRAPRLRDDADVVTLMRAIGTHGPCPSTFNHAPLDTEWAANLH